MAIDPSHWPLLPAGVLIALACTSTGPVVARRLDRRTISIYAALLLVAIGVLMLARL